jgi:hypothetical protein
VAISGDYFIVLSKTFFLHEQDCPSWTPSGQDGCKAGDAQKTRSCNERNNNQGQCREVWQCYKSKASIVKVLGGASRLADDARSRHHNSVETGAASPKTARVENLDAGYL